MDIDVAMPTCGGSEVIVETLERARASAAASPLNIRRILIDHRPDGDETAERVRGWAGRHAIGVVIHEAERTLPESREFLCREVATPWFLFLDDDVRVSESYFERLHKAISPAVGAVQGRKQSRSEHPSDWARRLRPE